MPEWQELPPDRRPGRATFIQAEADGVRYELGVRLISGMTGLLLIRTSDGGEAEVAIHGAAASFLNKYGRGQGDKR